MGAAGLPQAHHSIRAQQPVGGGEVQGALLVFLLLASGCSLLRTCGSVLGSWLGSGLGLWGHGWGGRLWQVQHVSPRVSSRIVWHLVLGHPGIHVLTLAEEDGALGNDRGMGNTVCFWPGVRWGMGAVLCFDTRTLTITLTGFYAVFGLTPDSVEARKFEPVPYPSSRPVSPTFYFIPTCLSHTLTDAPPRPAWCAEGIHVGMHRYGWEHVGVGGHVWVRPRASVQNVRALGATGVGPGACIGGLGVAECGRSGVGLHGVVEVVRGGQVGCGGPEVCRWDAVDHLELVA